MEGLEAFAKRNHVGPLRGNQLTEDVLPAIDEFALLFRQAYRRCNAGRCLTRGTNRRTARARHRGSADAKSTQLRRLKAG